MIKKTIKNIIKYFAKILIVIFSKFKSTKYFLEKINNFTNNQIKSIEHNEIKLKFFIPNGLNLMRVNTFSTKEPETLKWIDGFENESVFWDIGSNIGLYSCYAAKKKKCKVYSFEPSVFNLELLTKNIFLNNLNDLIVIFSLPLSSNCEEKKFNMSSIEVGSSISSFGEKIMYDGSTKDSVFNYKTVGITIDKMLSNFKISYPKYIKIDVDGIEHLILTGAKELLKNVDEILIEVDDKFKSHAIQVESILENSGFSMQSKSQSKLINKENKNLKTFNQIWVKK